MGKIPFADVDRLAGKDTPDEKGFGKVTFGQPLFIVNDQPLAKHVLVKDFDHFTDKRVFRTNNKINNAFLTNLEGAEWKSVRAMMSGVFTSGRLKGMTPYIAKVGANFE